MRIFFLKKAASMASSPVRREDPEGYAGVAVVEPAADPLPGPVFDVHDRAAGSRVAGRSTIFWKIYRGARTAARSSTGPSEGMGWCHSYIQCMRGWGHPLRPSG